MRFIYRLSLTFLLALFCFICQAQTVNLDKLSDQFIRSYSASNFEEMAALYHDSVHFTDPTLQYFQSNVDMIGKDKVITFLKNNITKENFPETKIIVQRKFVVGPIVMFDLLYTASVNAAVFGGEANKRVKISLPMFTQLHYKGNKIIEHRDYVDYVQYVKQGKEQLK